MVISRSSQNGIDPTARNVDVHNRQSTDRRLNAGCLFLTYPLRLANSWCWCWFELKKYNFVAIAVREIVSKIISFLCLQL